LEPSEKTADRVAKEFGTARSEITPALSPTVYQNQVKLTYRTAACPPHLDSSAGSLHSLRTAVSAQIGPISGPAFENTIGLVA